MFLTANINVHRCRYRYSLLRLSVFTNAEINVPYYGFPVHCCSYLCLLRISMFPTADMNVHRCGYQSSLLGISLFTNADFLITGADISLH
jgi:hypothetical protein